MKLPTTTSVEPSWSLLQEYRVSWAGLSSPLRTFSQQSPIEYRHTSLTNIWRQSQESS